MGLDSPIHLAVLLIVLVLLLRAGRLSKLGGALAVAIRGFRGSLRAEHSEPSPTLKRPLTGVTAAGAPAAPCMFVWVGEPVLAPAEQAQDGVRRLT
jgi:Sec-independent protein translocase protein TatA